MGRTPLSFLITIYYPLTLFKLNDILSQIKKKLKEVGWTIKVYGLIR